MKRVLIINADDLGYTRGVNASIFRCHSAGALPSTTIMANGEAFQDAVQRVGAHPDLGVGVHLVLTELEPTASPSQILDLLDPGGKLPPSPGQLLTALQRRRISVESIRKELHAQLTCVLDSGLSPTHMDTHKHVHLIPQVLDVVLDLAQAFGIRWIRNPFDDSPFFTPLVVPAPRKTHDLCEAACHSPSFPNVPPLISAEGTSGRPADSGQLLRGFRHRTLEPLGAALPPGPSSRRGHRVDAASRRPRRRLGGEAHAPAPPAGGGTGHSAIPTAQAGIAGTRCSAATFWRGIGTPAFLNAFHTVAVATPKCCPTLSSDQPRS